MPDIVRAAAEPFAHVGQFTVLNGAQGVTQALSEVIQQAGALALVARRTITPLLAGPDGQPTPGNGGAAASKPAAQPAPARRAPAPAPVAKAPPAKAPDAPKG
jgi:hypothetical protein